MFIEAPFLIKNVYVFDLSSKVEGFVSTMNGNLFPILFDEASNETKETFADNLDLYARSICDILENDGDSRLEKHETNLGFHGERITSFSDSGKVPVANSSVSFSFADAVASKYGSWECDALSESCSGFYAVLIWVSSILKISFASERFNVHFIFPNENILFRNTWRRLFFCSLRLTPAYSIFYKT